jgi:hypothetical protein
VLAVAQHLLFPGPFTYKLRRGDEEHKRLPSLYTLSTMDWAGRPVYTGSLEKGDISRKTLFGAEGHSRFSL